MIGEQLQRKKLLVPGFRPGNIRAQLRSKLCRRLVGLPPAENPAGRFSQVGYWINYVRLKRAIQLNAGRVIHLQAQTNLRGQTIRSMPAQPSCVENRARRRLR